MAGFDHVALPVADPAGVAQLLGELLGVAPGRDGPGDEFHCLRFADGSQLLLVATATPPPHHMAFRVQPDEFAGVVQRLTARGLAFGNDPDAPANGESSATFRWSSSCERRCEIALEPSRPELFARVRSMRRAARAVSVPLLDPRAFPFDDRDRAR